MKMALLVTSLFLVAMWGSGCATLDSLAASGLIYRNPQVYNVDYSFELLPDPNKIDRAKDLKLWMPIPREWDSQKAVRIISVQPQPHAEYEDLEHGNRMLFWDFGKGPEKPLYKVKMKYRLERYETYAEVDPNKIGQYDKKSKEYALYTRNTNTVHVKDKVQEIAQIAVGDEKNPYRQAERIFEFVMKKMRFKPVLFERGIKCLLGSVVVDEKTGEEYYAGGFHQFSSFFVALCRAVGIPARCITEISGWGPWMTQENIRPMHEWHGRFPGLSPEGLAAAQIYGPVTVHVWAEFYAPNYGWIPVVTAFGGRFGRLENKGVIISKGHNVKVGPYAPMDKSAGYGEQWVLLHNRRADVLGVGVWNIAKIHIAKAKILHHSDPFPADAFAGYAAKLYPEAKAEKKLQSYREDMLAWIDGETRGQSEKNAVLAHAYKEKPWLRYKPEPFICHMLREVVGDKKFFDIFETYTNLRIKSGEPVSTARFQKIAEDIYGKPLDWFFKQWIGYTELPHLKLDAVTLSKDEKGWCVRGNLHQLNSKLFRLPIELALKTEKTIERKTIWMETRKAGFEFRTSCRPKSILVDPDYDILKIQEMPPLLTRFWDIYPDLIVIYGTLSEAEANKTAAKRFNNEYLGLGNEIIKADRDVNEADLRTKCVILFGRPETNKTTQELKDFFPIKFDENKFSWQGTTYGQSTQGVAQIVENSDDPQSLMIMYAGLSGDATQKFCDLYLYDADASYVIFDGDKELLRADWEEADSDLVWKFESHAAGQKP